MWAGPLGGAVLLRGIYLHSVDSEDVLSSQWSLLKVMSRVLLELEFSMRAGVRLAQLVPLMFYIPVEPHLSRCSVKQYMTTASSSVETFLHSNSKGIPQTHLYLVIFVYLVVLIDTFT